MKSLFFLLLAILGSIKVAQSQAPTREQLLGTWIGESIEVDKKTFRPLPYRISFEPDSVLKLTLLTNPLSTQAVRWYPGEKAIRFDTVTYTPSRWKVRDDQLLIHGMTPLRFRKLLPIPLDSVQVANALPGRVWRMDSLSYRLYRDGTVCLENHKTGHTTLHYWRLVSLEGALFLIMKGTHLDADNHPHFPLQLIRIGPESLIVRGWNGQRWGDSDWISTGLLEPQKSCQPIGFQLCNTFLAPGDQKYPYFNFHRGRLGAIRRLVAQEYHPIPDSRQSGLIRFRFVVNCQGKAGMFEMLTLDENYERYQFDTRITEQLRRIVQEKITDWEPGKGTGNDSHNTYDTSCLLTFRLKNGHVVEIFP